jgi:alkylhydroperoxidase family enzyme
LRAPGAPNCALSSAPTDDRGILEVVEVTSYFNYVNRIADALGVVLEWRE